MKIVKQCAHVLAWIYHNRPKCTKSLDGKHAMITYQSTGTKECCDCKYKEPLELEV